MNSRVEKPSGQAPALVLMLKRAIPGHGKQRLAAEIGQGNTLLIADALLACALEDAVAWEWDLVFAVSRQSEAEWARGLANAEMFAGRSTRVLVQCAGNLGARLRDLDGRLRTANDRKILLMAADAPGLKTHHFRQSVQALDHADITLVRSADGGTDLMGSRAGWPDIAELPWGRAALCDKLAACCLDNGLATEQFSGSFDIDTRNDLVTVARSLESDERPARRKLVAQITRFALD